MPDAGEQRFFEPVHYDFETGTFRGWSTSRLPGPHSARVQSEVVRVGRYACRFELRAGDYISQGHRAELRDKFVPPWDTPVWYGFSTLVAADHATPKGVGLVMAQWHDQAEPGVPSGKPPVALRLRDGTLLVTGAHGRHASPDPEIRYLFAAVPDWPLGVWHDFVFAIRWSRWGTSRVEGWINGRPLVDWQGPLGYRNEHAGPYFKLGAYWSPPGEKPVVVYHDNYSRGHSFAEVDPSVLHGEAGG